MGECSFIELVKKHFGYLVEKYGFAVVAERYDPEIFGNGLVRFQSPSVIITVVLDRGQVLTDVQPYPEILGREFGLGTIIEFLAPEVSEPVYVFPDEWDDYWAMIEWQTARVACMLSRHCVSLLAGRFSEWEELNNIRKVQALNKYRALTGTNAVKITSRSAQEIVRKEMKKRHRGEVI